MVWAVSSPPPCGARREGGGDDWARTRASSDGHRGNSAGPGPAGTDVLGGCGRTTAGQPPVKRTGFGRRGRRVLLERGSGGGAQGRQSDPRAEAPGWALRTRRPHYGDLACGCPGRDMQRGSKGRGGPGSPPGAGTATEERGEGGREGSFWDPANKHVTGTDVSRAEASPTPGPQNDAELSESLQVAWRRVGAPVSARDLCPSPPGFHGNVLLQIPPGRGLWLDSPRGSPAGWCSPADTPGRAGRHRLFCIGVRSTSDLRG